MQVTIELERELWQAAQEKAQSQQTTLERVWKMRKLLL
jgi:hypothetical protein